VFTNMTSRLLAVSPFCNSTNYHRIKKYYIKQQFNEFIF
jgi:hypothetical protein